MDWTLLAQTPSPQLLLPTHFSFFAVTHSALHVPMLILFGPSNRLTFTLVENTTFSSIPLVSPLEQQHWPDPSASAAVSHRGRGYVFSTAMCWELVVEHWNLCVHPSPIPVRRHIEKHTYIHTPYTHTHTIARPRETDRQTDTDTHHTHFTPAPPLVTLVPTCESGKVVKKLIVTSVRNERSTT